VRRLLGRLRLQRHRRRGGPQHAVGRLGRVSSDANGERRERQPRLGPRIGVRRGSVASSPGSAGPRSAGP
jgi:hypothetical protein